MQVRMKSKERGRKDELQRGRETSHKVPL